MIIAINVLIYMQVRHKQNPENYIFFQVQIRYLCTDGHQKNYLYIIITYYKVLVKYTPLLKLSKK